MNKWQYFYMLSIKLYLPFYIHEEKSSFVHSIKDYVKLFKSVFFSRKKKIHFFNTLKWNKKQCSWKLFNLLSTRWLPFHLSDLDVATFPWFYCTGLMCSSRVSLSLQATLCCEACLKENAKYIPNLWYFNANSIMYFIEWKTICTTL